MSFMNCKTLSYSTNSALFITSLTGLPIRITCQFLWRLVFMTNKQQNINHVLQFFF